MHAATAFLDRSKAGAIRLNLILPDSSLPETAMHATARQLVPRHLASSSGTAPPPANSPSFRPRRSTRTPARSATP